MRRSAINFNRLNRGAERRGVRVIVQGVTARQERLGNEIRTQLIDTGTTYDELAVDEDDPAVNQFVYGYTPMATGYFVGTPET